MNVFPSSVASLTSCQEKALDILQREGNVFLTGAAGTGKSYLLEKYLSGKPSEHFPVVASTGAAAVLVGGRTFHSFFGIGILEGGIDATVARAIRSKKLLYRLQSAYCVIIDEISMLSGMTLQAAELVARKARNSDKPWGGLRIIAVGDFAQLPPVTQSNQAKDWAFRHSVWTESEFQPALLSTVMRTQDLEFLTVLNFIREGIVNDTVSTFLDDHSSQYSQEIEGTRLYPHRAQAESYNLRRLASLETAEHVFPTHYVGHERALDAAKRSIPIPDTLVLKKGALIMMRKNDMSGQYEYVNGSLGIVTGFDDDVLYVRLLSGPDIEVMKEKFSYIDGDGAELLAAWNFPVTLAWATTIHKAQGASLDRMIVDLANLWEPGQAYVALSRVRSGAGLMIERWSPGSIRAEPLVTDFYNNLVDLAEKYVPKAFFSVPIYGPKPEQPRSGRKLKPAERIKTARTMLRQKESLEAIADICEVKVGTVINYIEKLLVLKESLDLTYLIDQLPYIDRMRALFIDHGFEYLKPVFDAFDGKVDYDTLRLVRVVLMDEKQKSEKRRAERMYTDTADLLNY